MYPHHRSRIGFTLIELLVVVAIISLLVSILLPTLGRAKKLAQSVHCMSNLRNMGVGIIMYMGENTGWMPCGEWNAWPSDPSATARWYTLINPYVGGEGDTTVSAGVGTSGSTLSEIFQCAGAPIRKGYNHYTSNPILMGRKSEASRSDHPAGIPHLRGHNLRVSSELVMVMDGTQSTNSGNSSAVAFMMDWGQPFWAAYSTNGLSDSRRCRVVPWDDYGQVNNDGASTPPLGRPRWRHGNNDMLNVVYLDGHADSHPPYFLTEDNFFPRDWAAHP